ncbi:phosphotransferase [Ornithinibacillus xuwenensis]|uniref:Phosphotransferase n=1 Tax=Ornithinibacillus xuwenensis TaxID=3144668 RepID=A0ABU9XG68_9BACI
MSYELRRDDNRNNRLSSFLLWEGNLETSKIHPIKRNVYFIEENTGRKLILKGHSNEINMKQQWEFFESIRSKEIVPFLRFPNGKKEITTGTNYFWTISPYVSGRKLNYKYQEDRKRAIDTLKKFHQKAQEIHVKNMVRKQLFYKRWTIRLNKFKETEHIFYKYRFEKLFNDITSTMSQYIDIVSRYPWFQEQLDAERKGIWVHGDVASHNFIQNEHTFIIDFDLLQSTSQIYDYIQLGQRFLPFIDWDAEKLLAYNVVTDVDVEKYLLSVFIPSDLLREWLHFLNRSIPNNLYTYLQSLEEEWIKRKKFLNMSKIMVK